MDMACLCDKSQTRPSGALSLLLDPDEIDSCGRAVWWSEWSFEINTRTKQPQTVVIQQQSAMQHTHVQHVHHGGGYGYHHGGGGASLGMGLVGGMMLGAMMDGGDDRGWGRDDGWGGCDGFGDHGWDDGGWD